MPFVDKKVLITVNTGFNKSCPTLWLHKLGAKITDISLSPVIQRNHWNFLELKRWPTKRYS
jgi:hypothetical protein